MAVTESAADAQNKMGLNWAACLFCHRNAIGLCWVSNCGNSAKRDHVDKTCTCDLSIMDPNNARPAWCQQQNHLVPPCLCNWMLKIISYLLTCLATPQWASIMTMGMICGSLHPQVPRNLWNLLAKPILVHWCLHTQTMGLLFWPIRHLWLCHHHISMFHERFCTWISHQNHALKILSEDTSRITLKKSSDFGLLYGPL